MEISKEETKAALEEVLADGDDVLVHASLGGLGYFNDGIESIIETFIDIIGPRGTLIMMTATRSFAKTQEFSLDQPSETGVLTEKFRTFSGVVRSRVPMVSFCALGPKAEEYTQAYNSHLDDSSTIARLLANDGKIVLFGLGFEYCTLYHLSEERLNVPYNFYKLFSGSIYEKNGSVQPISQKYFVRKDMGTKKDPQAAGCLLRERGRLNQCRLGRGNVIGFRARDFDACCMRVLEENPDAFLIS